MSRKVISVILSICMIFSLLAITAVSASATTDPVTKRALVMSAPYDGGAIREATKNAMTAAFRNLGITTTSFVNDAAGNSPTTFLNKITQTLGSADVNDLSYVYIYAHGSNSGNLRVSDSGNLTLAQLKSTLNSISGNIVLIIDSCHSGNAIAQSADISDIADEYNASQIMLNQFLYAENGGVMPMSGEFVGSNKYTVFCSSLSTQSSWALGGLSYTAIALSSGFGYDAPNNVATNEWLADVNDDDIITANELGVYTREEISKLQPNVTEDDLQTLCYYSHNQMCTAIYKDYPLGDVNMDYVVNGQDVLRLREYVSNITTLSARQLQLADCNADGEVNGKDTLALRKYVADIADNAA